MTSPPPTADCRECLAYLTRALDNFGSRPGSLLRSMGIIMNENKVYELMEGGRGVIISLEEKENHNIIDINDNYEQQIKKKSSNNEILLPFASHETMRRRTADPGDVGDVATAGTGVLTTSPAIHRPLFSAAATPTTTTKSKKITTIAIECVECKSDTRAEAGARAFVSGPDKLGIVLCSNRLASQEEVDEVLVHELVHIYDAHSRKMDLRDCKQLAYSEVRAAREAECSNIMTSFTANICAKDTATRATRNMFPEFGRQCVCDVFDIAMKDLTPFVNEDIKSVALRRAGFGYTTSGGRGKASSPLVSSLRPQQSVSTGQQHQKVQSSPPFPASRSSDR